MNIEKECLDCIYNQAQRVCSLLDVNAQQKQDITLLAKEHIEKFNHNSTPPHNATPMYEDIAKYLKCEDLYAKIKKDSSANAQKYVLTCKENIEASNNKLKAAIKTAVVGNVIDLAAEVMFDLHEEIAKVFEKEFAIDDFEVLQNQLKKTKKLVYLADNAGEEIFDKVCIEVIKELYPDIKVFYFVRGKPIINDLTISHAKASGLDSVATLIDSGVPTPGYALDLASAYSKELFYSADCIISKRYGKL